MADKKRTGPLDWEDLRYFAALARHGTLSATARVLRVNHATVSRRIVALETALGHPLFDRRPDGYALTAQGKTVLDDARVMDEAALSVQRRLDAGSELSGLIRLAVGRVLAERFLVDRLAGFRQKYPLIDLEIIGHSRAVSLARREADMALRFGSPKDSDLIARRVATLRFGLYASPAYRDEVKRGKTPEYIGYDEESDFIAEATWLNREFADNRFSFRSSTQTMQAAAARCGYGIALLPKYVAALEPGLVAVSFPAQLPEREVWLVVRRDLTRVPRIKTLTDYLVDVFRRERRLLGS
ncbi:MAG: LysR family transcriptional regulator [Xanthobacteraceae bacterium]